ncbi:MAG TPA: hypothetical protein VF190_15445 [Rhodothermales bacterium]
MRVLSWAWLVVVLVASTHAAGCGDNPRPRPVDSDDGAFATLSALRYDYIRQASENLRRIDHTRIVETVQMDSDGDTSAAERFVVRYVGGEGSVLDSSIEGGFRSGAIARLFGPEPDHTPDTSTFVGIIPDDAAFMTARNREAFVYRLTRSDTLPAVEVTVRDPHSMETRFDRALLVYEPDSRQVVRIELNGEERSWLLESESASRLSLQRTDSATWIPERFSVDERRKVPLQRAYRVSKTEVYEPASQASD